MNASELLPLLVAVPLLGAGAVPLLAKIDRRLPRLATVAVLCGQAAFAVAIAWFVASSGPLTTVVGEVPAAYGIGMLADRLSIAMVVLVGAVSTVIFATGDAGWDGTTCSLWLLLVGGLTGVTITADVFNLYVFLEISGLATYALVATARGPTAALGALKYLLVGTVGATLYLLGVGYVYVATGTLAMTDLTEALAVAGYDSTLVVAAFVLMVTGLGVKLALFPLHAWKPDAYAAAPPTVAAALAALGSTVAGYALVRVAYGVFTPAFFDSVPLARTALLAFGGVSVVSGGVLALRANDVRRLLAYSSVSQFGLIGVGIALVHPLALTGALVGLVGHAVAKGGLFVAVGSLGRSHGAETMAEYSGLANERPVVAAGVAVLAVSLVGLPPTVGFAAKWSIALGAVESGVWTVAGIVVASTLLSLAYAGRLIERLYLPPDQQRSAVTADGGRPTASSPTHLTVVVVAAALVVVLGLVSSALGAWFAPVVEGWL